MLGDGEKKVTEEVDTRKCNSVRRFFASDSRNFGLISTSTTSNVRMFIGVPHASVFTFKKEDHTLGNLLNMRLHQNPHVTFTGYKVPHPLFRYVP